MADELCLSSTCKFNFNNNSYLFFFYDLSLLCSFIFSHPLYFSYFLFFSPYLFKFISFISPLFFTTTLLLLLSFLATTFPQPKLGFIQTVLDNLRSKLNDVVDGDEEFCNFEDFEIYKIVFHDPPLITIGDDNDEASVMENQAVSLFEEIDRFEDSTPAIEKPEKENSSNLGEIVGELQKLEPVEAKKLGSKLLKNNKLVFNDLQLITAGDDKEEALVMENPVAVTKLESLFEEIDRFEDSTAAMETPEKESSSDLVGELPKSVMKKLGSKSMANVEELCFAKSNSWRVDSSSSFGSYGSMRKEKEWKRTLACKLFEERRSSEGGEEGMDSLWEAYEDDNSSKRSKQKKTKSKQKMEFKYFDDDLEEEDDDDEEEFMRNGQLCCLKALKLSAGKMNLGMGKPNLMKISKALKGFGWLHHVGSKRGKRI